MATLKITQVKSRIGASAQQRKNLDALGLKKINQSVEHSDSVIIKGMLDRVKPLVKIEERDGKTLCTLWDEGVPYIFNLEKWLANTKFGGGFVRVMGTERELK